MIWLGFGVLLLCIALLAKEVGALRHELEQVKLDMPLPDKHYAPMRRGDLTR